VYFRNLIWQLPPSEFSDLACSHRLDTCYCSARNMDHHTYAKSGSKKCKQQPQHVLAAPTATIFAFLHFCTFAGSAEEKRNLVVQRIAADELFSRYSPKHAEPWK